MKILAKDWFLPAAIVLILDIVSSVVIWSMGGYDLNPLYQGTLFESIFILVISHALVYIVPFFIIRYLPKDQDGLGFFVVFLVYLVVWVNNAAVLLRL